MIKIPLLKIFKKNQAINKKARKTVVKKSHVSSEFYVIWQLTSQKLSQIDVYTLQCIFNASAKRRQ